MAKGGVIGNGIKIGYSTALSPPTYTTMASEVEVKVPGLVADKINSSVHGASSFKRHMPGMIEVGDLEITFLGDLDAATSADQAAMLTHLKSGDTIAWRIEIPVTRSQASVVPVTYNGWVQSWEPGTPREDKQTMVAKIVYDDATFTVGASGASIL
jgi:hypothetical protein